MTRRKRKRSMKQLVPLVRQCSPEIILRAASRCDGHSIRKPEAFIDAGLPIEVVEHLTLTYQSYGSHKGTIFVRGQPVKELAGVYGLDLLKFLAAALDVTYARKIGRGFQAQAIQSALRQHYAHVNPAPPAS